MTKRYSTRHLLGVLAIPALFLGACNGDDSATTDATATAGSSTTTTTATATATGTDSGSESATSSESDSDATTLTTGDPTSDSSSTTMGVSDSATTDGTTDGTTAGTTVGTTDGTTGDPDPVCGNGIVEVGEDCDDGNDVDKDKCSNACTFVPCAEQEGMGGMFDYSYIWVANTSQGTVSKIDTQTLVELGRYRTDPNTNASPSRTAVNVDGRFAAVANRTAGTIAAFAADEDDCVDVNNDGMITTSSGANDIKAFGEDECMLWHITVEPNNNGNNQKGPRPLGWDFADQNPNTCKWETHTLWAGWYSAGGAAYFWHLDGTDGTVLDDVEVPVWGSQNSWGPYGGAVDSDHNFWVAGWHGPLIRINTQDLSVDMWNDPMLNQVDSYGMALDGQGRPWFGGCSGEVVRFDPDSETFKNLGDTGGCLRGLMVDGNGTAWIAGNGSCRLVEVDTATDTIVNPNIPIPGCQTPVGISIDAEGFVWVVDQNGKAYKMNPDDYSFEEFSGLSGPYTYSDMTGAGIQLQALPQ